MNARLGLVHHELSTSCTRLLGHDEKSKRYKQLIILKMRRGEGAVGGRGGQRGYQQVGRYPLLPLSASTRGR